MGTITFRPFSNGEQWGDWQASNCERCVKYNPAADSPDQTCPIEFELSLGGWEGDGKIGEATAKAMGFLDEAGNENGNYVWPCAIVEWTQEWQDAVARRKGFKNAAEMLAAKGGSVMSDLFGLIPVGTRVIVNEKYTNFPGLVGEAATVVAPGEYQSEGEVTVQFDSEQDGEYYIPAEALDIAADVYLRNAAPDLLAACESALAEFERITGDIGFEPERFRERLAIMSELASAVAKAAKGGAE